MSVGFCWANILVHVTASNPPGALNRTCLRHMRRNGQLRRMEARSLVFIFIALGCLMHSPAHGQAPVEDNFEDQSLAAEWQFSTTINLSSNTGQPYSGVLLFPVTAPVHSTNQSVGIDVPNTDGTDVSATLRYQFANSVYGEVRVWVYDSGVGGAPAWSVILANGVSNVIGVTVGGANAQHYTGFERGVGGTYPSSFERTAGWHEITLATATNRVRITVDGEAVYSTGAKRQFDRVELTVQPDGTNGGSVFLDDFAYSPTITVKTNAPNPTNAFTGKLSFVSYATSFSFGPFTNGDSILFFSTYDDAAEQPHVFIKTNTIFFNSEAKPVADEPGTYQTGYTLRQDGRTLEAGKIVVHVDSPDANSDGVPDLVQQELAVTNTFTAEVIPTETYLYRRTQPSFSGTFTRAKLSYTGRVVATGIFSSSSLTTGWLIRRAGGSMTYSRGPKRNLLEFAAGLPFTGNRSNVTKPFRTRFTIVDEDHVLVTGYKMKLEDRTRPRQPDVLYQRVGKEYVAAYQVRDGNLRYASPFSDYTGVITKLRVSDDSDGDGVPDFSDADFQPPVP
jgi:hypothetical protein